MNKKQDENELAAKARRLFKAILDLRKKPTVKAIRHQLKVRRTTASAIHKRLEIECQGMTSITKRKLERVGRLPCFDIVGIHAQGEVGPSVDGKDYEHSFLLGVVVAGKGFPNLRESKTPRSAKLDLLAPSFISSDKMRIAEFETILPNLLGRLDDPFDPQILPEEFTKGVLNSLAIQDAGYSVCVFLFARGRAKALLNDLIPSIDDFDHKVCEIPPVELLAELATRKDIACLGPGFFPLMGSSVALMENALSDPKPTKSFHLSWNAEDINAAVMGRMAVCDRLAGEGFLVGAPQTRHGEMANRTSSPISHKLLARDYIYSDGLEPAQSSKQELGLTIPTRIPHKLFQKLDVDWRDRKDFLGIEMLTFDDKEVECLVAWLPSLRQVLLHSVEQNRLLKIHNRWISAQSECIQMLGNVRHPRCTEIINPAGLMTLSATSKSSAMKRDLLLGLVITTYDSDFLVRHLMSEANRKEFSLVQEQWLKLMVGQIENKANRGRILRLTDFSKWDLKEEALNEYIFHIKVNGSRLIRFVIEQAAVNFSNQLLTTARKHGIDPTHWPEESEISKDVIASLLQEGSDYWPAVGIRMDSLLIRSVQKTLNRARYRWRKARERNEMEQAYEKEKCVQVKINNQYREIYHEMNFDTPNKVLDAVNGEDSEDDSQDW